VLSGKVSFKSNIRVGRAKTTGSPGGVSTKVLYSFHLLSLASCLL